MWVTPLCVAAVLNYCDPLPNKIMDLATTVDRDKATEVAELIGKYAAKENLDPYLVASIMYVESRFGEQMDSRSGKDHGPMQINEWWFPRLGIRRADVLSFEGGLKWGTKILAMARAESRRGGVWWSAYNSRAVSARRRYEVKVKGVFATLTRKPNRSGVKALGQDVELFSAPETGSLL